MAKPDRGRIFEHGGSAARTILLIAIIAAVAGLVWYTGSRIRQLNRELALSEERAKQMNERLREYSEELEKAIGQARAARSRAETAEQKVEDTTRALAQAEQQVENVSAEREQARAEASKARNKAAQTQAELAGVRERRLAELDRMQAALNKIAPTKRTPAGMIMMLSDEDFRFAFDKATLTAANREKLSRIAGILLASEGYRLFIDGHTDDQGSANYNQGLSERRANSVRDYLVKAGIPAEVIETKGFGKTQPLEKAKTKAARAKNRRVEIGIVDTIIHYEKTARK